ncbi:MAG: tRNA (N6-isopentenyl adenosine(37)-C2)-methylthiotransferase MiaB [Planctomycetota bacterium]|nr:tRNA (N6-isopentenyl adenosine(37)-C2)-methylthiotransferase MiaB [Planctomycetota bacterium]
MTEFTAKPTHPPDHNRKLFIETVGCQMNELDSELVVAALRNQGYELTPDVKQADTVLFNTCSVREHAEHKIYSALGRLKYSKRQRPNQVIGVIGCMAQKDQMKVFQRAPHVDMVVGTGQLSEIPRLIDEARQDRTRKTALSLGRRDGSRDQVSGSFQSYDPLRDPEMRPTPFQAYVRIVIGCDKFCTYCVVPMTRGPEQSRSPRDIHREIQVLADQGVKEITLLGQTVNSYRHTQDGRLFTLADLLELIHDTPGIDRIRFVTNYPKDMDRVLLQAVRDLPKVVRYLHVPAQSGCNDVLKRMKRGYTVEDYREMMGRIADIVPGCSVSSDFIVGFCGETDTAFQKSMDLISEFRFKNSFIFKYSPRTGTRADELFEDDVPESVKKRRNNEMLALQNEISEEDNVEFIGREAEVLVEGPSKATLKRQKSEAHVSSPVPVEGAPTTFELGLPFVDAELPDSPAIQLTGRTDCDRIVVFDGNPRLIGSLATVEVHDCTATTLIGSIVTREVTHGMARLLPVVQ